MREPSLDGLHARLERLEREVGWWRRVGVAALAGVGLFGAIAATVTTNPDEVKTRRLVITDGEGRGRARVHGGRERPHAPVARRP